MSTATRRFPKAAFARQLDDLALELEGWIYKYKTDALDENRWLISEEQWRRADNRQYALEDLAHRLRDISLTLEALQ